MSSTDMTDLASALEDVSQMRNPEREALWASTNADARKVLSYRENLLSPAVRGQLVASIANYHGVYWLLRHCQSQEKNVSSELARHIVEFAWAGSGKLVPFVQPLLLRGREEGGEEEEEEEGKMKKDLSRMGAFSILIRPRPMTTLEKTANNYHVISTTSPTSLTLHVGRVHRSGNRLSTEHRRYEFDGVFGEEGDDNNEVGEKALGVVGAQGGEGGGRTVICYGQTGTGKTYTFKAVLDVMKNKLANLEEAEGSAVYITFYEIHGKKCYDLMNERKTIRVLTDSNDKVVPLGARVAKFDLKKVGEGGEECKARFDDIIKSALALRSTTSTQRNDLSSRSHSILTITLRDEEEERKSRRKEEERMRLEREKQLAEEGGEEAGVVEGLGKPDGQTERCASPPLDTSHPAFALIRSSLRLVDLAGSEQNVDTGKMAARDHKESAEINTALMHLKECIRGYGKKGGKYRGHLLTRVLKECFEDKSHRSTVVATISPTTLDLLHTLNTLNHVAVMQMGKGVKKGTDKGAVVKEKEFMLGVVETTTVEVPLCEGGVGFNKPVESWTPSDVKRWLAVANGGKFGHVVMPAGVDGRALLGLNEVTLGELFDVSHENIQARGEREGSTWVISGWEAGGGSRSDWGRELYQALRIEQKYIEKKLIKEGKESEVTW